MTPLLRTLGSLSALNFAIRAHTREETQKFADDIIRKVRITQRSQVGE
ncbi:hypothetical protein [Amycolatopsis balhimycina]|nr:hypothetical protein [Amycolatopsis balhimycina]